MYCSHYWFDSADDGYRLWLKYDRLTNQRMIDIYNDTITGMMVGGYSETAGFARTELTD